MIQIKKLSLIAVLTFVAALMLWSRNDGQRQEQSVSTITDSQPQVAAEHTHSGGILLVSNPPEPTPTPQCNNTP